MENVSVKDGLLVKVVFFFILLFIYFSSFLLFHAFDKTNGFVRLRTPIYINKKCHR